MPEALIVGVMRQAIELALMVSLPMLLAGMIAGILVSMLQTITSVHDSVLAFIPRALAIFGVFALTFPWMFRMVSSFTKQLLMRLPEFVR